MIECGIIKTEPKTLANHVIFNCQRRRTLKKNYLGKTKKDGVELMTLGNQVMA